MDLYGLRLPQLREATLDLDDILEAAGEAADQELDDQHRERVTGRRPIRQRGRNPAVALEVAYMARIEGRTHEQIHHELRSSETPQVTKRVRGSDGVLENIERFRGVERVIRKGDEIWASLGAWPWATFNGQLPKNWRADADAQDSLAIWYRHARSGKRLPPLPAG